MAQFYCYWTLSSEEQISIGKVIKAKNLKQAEKKFHKLMEHIVCKHNTIIHYKELHEVIEKV